MKITKELLKSLNACQNSYEMFVRTWPEGLELPECIETVEAKKHDIINDIIWIQDHLKIPNLKVTHDSNTWEYNSQGLCIKFTDHNGLSETWEYDPNGLCIKHTDFDGVSEYWEYNSQGLKTKYTHYDGDSSTWEYNSQGLKTKYTNHKGRSETWEYDSNGLKTKYTDFKGNVILFNNKYEGFLKINGIDII